MMRVIKLRRGDTQSVLCKATGDLNGRFLTFTMKKSYDDPDSAAVLQKTVQITQSKTEYTFNLAPVETDSIEPMRYICDFQSQASATDVRTEEVFWVELQRDVTRTTPLEITPDPNAGGYSIEWSESFNNFEVTA